MKELTQQNQDLASSLAAAQEAAGKLQDTQVTQLEAALTAAKREGDVAKACAEELKQRLAAMADSHEQELEQLRPLL